MHGLQCEFLLKRYFVTQVFGPEAPHSVLRFSQHREPQFDQHQLRNQQCSKENPTHGRDSAASRLQPYENAGPLTVDLIRTVKLRSKCLGTINSSAAFIVTELILEHRRDSRVLRHIANTSFGKRCASW
jgi:hypothetical protein